MPSMHCDDSNAVGCGFFFTTVHSLQLGSSFRATISEERREAVAVVRAGNAAAARAVRSGSGSLSLSHDSQESLDGLDAGPLQASGSSMQMSSMLADIGTKLQQSLAETTVTFLSCGKQVVSSLQKAFERVLTKQRPAASFTSEAANCGIDRKALKRTLQQSACYLVMMSGYAIGLLLSRLTDLAKGQRPPHRPVLLCVRRAYDETPSRMTVKWLTHEEQAKVRAKQEGTAKILQTNLEVIALMQHVESKQFYSTRMRMPAWLQAMDRTTAEVTLRCQRDVLGMIPNLADFGERAKLHIHIANTDKYSANLKCERNLLRALGISENSANCAMSHYVCDVHKAHTCQSRTLSMVDGHISAIIATALSCAEAGSVRMLRASMARSLQDKLHVCFGPRPENDFNLSYRSAVLDAFLPLHKTRDDETERDLKRQQDRSCWSRRARVVIEFFLHDDLQNHNELWYHTEAWAIEKEHVHKLMVKYLVPILIPGLPPLFSRSRWNGFQDALSFFGLAEACHGLLRSTLLDYLRAKPTETTLPQAPQGPMALDDGGQGLADPLTAEAAEGEDEDAMSVRQQIEAVTGNVDWADLRLRMKVKVSTWLHVPVLPALVVTNHAVAPLSHLFQRMLSTGSTEWEKAQQTRVARGRPRTFQILEAARGVDMKQFRADMSAALHEQLVLIPTASHHRQFQASCFCVCVCWIQFSSLLNFYNHFARLLT